MVQYVNGSGGLNFEYLSTNPSGTLVATTNPSAVQVVRARLQISKNGRVQNLTTDINLRNRNF